MKLVKIHRKTRLERRYSKKMGMMATKVTYVRKTVMGIPFKTLHKYRETYYGEVKDCEDCNIAA